MQTITTFPCFHVVSILLLCFLNMGISASVWMEVPSCSADYRVHHDVGQSNRSIATFNIILNCIIPSK